jgi:hypothetical protein
MVRSRTRPAVAGRSTCFPAAVIVPTGDGLCNRCHADQDEAPGVQGFLPVARGRHIYLLRQGRNRVDTTLALICHSRLFGRARQVWRRKSD